MYPCKVGSAWEVLAPAKLNLYLEVLGRRPDGFHELETLMVPVRIYDHLGWTQHPAGADGFELRIRQFPSSGNLPQRSYDNLVVRAAKLLARDSGIVPHGQFRLTKRIPTEAGMGGGSSDAAATLLLANVAWNLNYPRERLAALAEELGSDVPFFLSSRPARCRGRGEQIEPLSPMPRLHLVVVKPDDGLSTAKIFDHLDPQSYGTASQSSARLSKLVSALGRGALSQAGSLMTNRLEPVASRLSPSIDRLRRAFAQCHCHGHGMTGSGTAYVGLMRSAIQARTAAQTLSGMNLGSVFATSSC